MIGQSKRRALGRGSDPCSCGDTWASYGLYLGLLWVLIRLGLLNRDAGTKAMVPIGIVRPLFLKMILY